MMVLDQYLRYKSEDAVKEAPFIDKSSDVYTRTPDNKVAIRVMGNNGAVNNTIVYMKAPISTITDLNKTLNPIYGQAHYVVSENKIYVWDGAAWKGVGGETTTTQSTLKIKSGPAVELKDGTSAVVTEIENGEVSINVLYEEKKGISLENNKLIIKPDDLTIGFTPEGKLKTLQEIKSDTYYGPVNIEQNKDGQIIKATYSVTADGKTTTENLNIEWNKEGTEALVTDTGTTPAPKRRVKFAEDPSVNTIIDGNELTPPKVLSADSTFPGGDTEYSFEVDIPKDNDLDKISMGLGDRRAIFVSSRRGNYVFTKKILEEGGDGWVYSAGGADGYKVISKTLPLGGTSYIFYIYWKVINNKYSFKIADSHIEIKSTYGKVFSTTINWKII